MARVFFGRVLISFHTFRPFWFVQPAACCLCSCGHERLHVAFIHFALTSVKAAAHLTHISTFQIHPPPPIHIFACREEKRQRVFPPYCPDSESLREQQAGPDQTGRCGERGRVARRPHCRYDIIISCISCERCCRFPFLWLSGCVRTRSL